MKFSNQRFNGLLLIALIAILPACSKDAGEGGAAKITGTVMVQDYNAVTHQALGSPYLNGKENVYIIYGGDSETGTFDDKTETSYDGTFQFRFLRKGKYTIFVYSDVVPKPAFGEPDKYVIKEDIEITDKKGEVSIPTITIKKYL